jgi:hypothetical protein
MTTPKDATAGPLHRVVLALCSAALLACGCREEATPRRPVVCTIANNGECMAIAGPGERLARILTTYFDSTMPRWREWDHADGRVALIARTRSRDYCTIVLDTKDEVGWKAYNEAIRGEMAGRKSSDEP